MTPQPLEQGQQRLLDGIHFDLSQVTIGLGWDVRSRASAWWQRLTGKEPVPFDLDLACFIAGPDDKVAELGTEYLVGGDVVFFSNRTHSSGKIWLTKDNRDGSGKGDDEQIVARLLLAGPEIHRLVLVATVYEGQKKGQHFGQLDNAYIRATDAKGNEMARYQLHGNAYKGKTVLLFAEIFRTDRGWVFEAKGEGVAGEGFVGVLRRYV
jgi:tellurium resistance protein TerD